MDGLDEKDVRKLLSRGLEPFEISVRLNLPLKEVERVAEEIAMNIGEAENLLSDERR